MEESIKELLDEYLHGTDFGDIKEPQNENILYLAYIGDTIFELFTRDYLIRKFLSKSKMEEIHQKNVKLVCAKSQARIIEKLIDDSLLNDDEINFYKHARNAHSNSKSKNSSIVDYRKATGFEALLGLLFYTKKMDRLINVLTQISKYIEENNLSEDLT